MCVFSPCICGRQKVEPEERSFVGSCGEINENSKHTWLMQTCVKEILRKYVDSKQARVHQGASGRSFNAQIKVQKVSWVRSRNLCGKIKTMEVVEDFDSRLHQAFFFAGDGNKEIQEWREQKKPKALPGFSSVKLPRRCTTEKSREEGHEEKEDRKKQMRSEVTEKIVTSMLEDAGTVGGGVTGNKGPISESTKC